MQPSSDIRVRELLIVLALFVVGVIYVVPTISAKDPLWFWRRFDAVPQEIVIYTGGAAQTLRAGDAGFERITQLVNQLVARPQSYTPLGVSAETVADYRSREHAIELRYAGRVRIHSSYRFGPGDALLLPLTGRHSESHPVFTAQHDNWMIGALHLPSVTPLVELLQELNYW